MPDPALTPEERLELAIIAYLVANYHDGAEPLADTTFYPGHASAAKNVQSFIVVRVMGRGGPHARQGNYESEVRFEVVTNKCDQPTDTATRKVQHERRVEAIQGIFADTRAETVAAAVMALDAELGVSGYWTEGQHDRDYSGDNFVTVLPRQFAYHLV